ncbi:MAG: hypothetical protein QOC66_2178 [Pseudonocardiales bacterium]|jgi:hypothetical protein|nr:hypothetical protein [Pseudonocardiales bacterium]
MRVTTKVLSGVTALGLAATLTACSGDNKDKKPVGEFKTLTGNATTVVLDPGFVSALTSLKLTPGTFGTAKIEQQGSNTDAVFPITGGNAKIYKKGDVTPYVQGQVEHDGSGLTLAAGGTTVTLKNFVVHPGNNSNLTGEVDVATGGKTTVAAKSMKLFDLDGTTLKTPTISKAGVATLEGTTIYLSAEAAKALNGVFKTDALAGGQKVKIGTAIIRATGS